jgi:hypothetical protein
MMNTSTTAKLGCSAKEGEKKNAIKKTEQKKLRVREGDKS